MLGVGALVTIWRRPASCSAEAPAGRPGTGGSKGSIAPGDYSKTGEIDWQLDNVGIGEDFIPDICDLSQVRAAYTISDAESFATARELLGKEGVLAGSSSGTLLAAALRYCREQTEPKRVVVFACDTGNKYLIQLHTTSGWKIRRRLSNASNLVICAT